MSAARRDFNAWHSDKTVRSGSLAIGTLNPPEGALATLYEGIERDARVAVPGLPFGTEDVEKAAWEQLNPEARSILGSLASSFFELVRADIARSPGTRLPNGAGEIRLRAMPSRAGVWHVDNLMPTPYEGIFESGMRRYVVAFGVPNHEGISPTTRFLHGPTTKSEAQWLGVTQDPSARFREVAHPVGTVACFSSNFGIHRSPASEGPRVFMTLSSLIVADRTPPRPRN